MQHQPFRYCQTSPSRKVQECTLQAPIDVATLSDTSRGTVHVLATQAGIKGERGVGTGGLKTGLHQQAEELSKICSRDEPDIIMRLKGIT